MPQISVILPVFNTELYIKEAIDSMLNQSFTDFELLIFDDGSTDETSKIIQSFDDNRIVHKRFKTNIGYLPHLNEGLKVARGKYIARMDADDIASAERLEIQYSYMESNPDVGICGSWFELIGSGNGIIKTPVTFKEIQYQLFFGCPLNHPTVMMRKDFIDKYNLKYEQRFYYAEDHDFFATASFYFKIVNVPQVLLKYRIHTSQIGSAKWKEQELVRSRVQAKMLSKALVSTTHEDIAWLEEFLAERSIPSKGWLSKVSDFKAKLINDNKIKLIYPPDLLEKVCGNLFETKIALNIYKYFINRFYNRSKYNLSLFYLFLKEDISFKKYVSSKLILLLLLKCIIGYSKKSVVKI